MTDLGTTLIDETAEPPLRFLLGSLLASADTAAFAIRRIRIAGIDLSAAELGPVRTCRVLVGRLDAAALHDLPTHSSAPRRHALDTLLRFAASGRLAVRVAPTSGWNPDFSVFTGIDGSPDTCIVGSHYFQEPDPPDGPAFTGIFRSAGAVAATSSRFDRLWESAYDVLPAVTDAIQSLLLALP